MFDSFGVMLISCVWVFSVVSFVVCCDWMNVKVCVFLMIRLVIIWVVLVLVECCIGVLCLLIIFDCSVGFYNVIV